MRRAAAGLADLGVKAEVADQLARIGEPLDLADRGTNVAAVIRLTPGTVIRRLTAAEASACSAMPRSMSAISVSR